MAFCIACQISAFVTSKLTVVVYCAQSKSQSWEQCHKARSSGGLCNHTFNPAVFEMGGPCEYFVVVQIYE